MSEGEEMHYDTFLDLLDRVNFEIDLRQIMNDEDDDNAYMEKNMELNMELNKIAHDVIFQFFAECYDAAEGNQIPLRFYLRRLGVDD